MGYENSLSRGVIGTLAVFLASAGHALAIEQLKLSVQCSDVVLRWPSTTGETYIVQYRPTLDASTPWQTLTSSLPANAATNLTFFVHSNIVAYPTCGGGSESAMAGGEAEYGSSEAPEYVEPPVPLAMPLDGSSSAVPLILYPPGFDLSDFVIFDPITEEWTSGAGYTANQESLDPPDPEQGEGGGGEDFLFPPDTGFYRVVRNGVHLVGVTNGMALSDIVTVPVEVGADAGDLVALCVREAGSPVGSSPAVAPFQFPLHVVLDTTAMSNGVHHISGFASWNSGGDEGSGSGMDAESPAITVTVSNEITFPNWVEHFGELYSSLVILAQSGHPDADWYIDVYGANAGYIGTFGSHTYNGLIEVAWNLVGPPPNFIVYTNEPYFDFVVSTEFVDGPEAQGEGDPQPEAAGGATSPPKRTYKQVDNWVSKGMWVVANQQAWEGTVGHDTLDMATDGFVLIADGAGLTTRPSHPYAEAYRIGYGDGVPVATRNAQWADMRAAIYHQQSRNMFYLGHGSPDGIGAGADTNRFIPASEIAARLHTLPAGQTNRHGYRFVFLYGCETASGTLPESFGMIHREDVSIVDFGDAGITPGAFVGWNHKQAAAIIGSTLLDNANYVQHFQYEWTTTGLGVKECLDRAKDRYSDVTFIDRDKLKVFGNWGLRVLGYNR